MNVMSSLISHLIGRQKCVCENHMGQRTNQTITHNLHGEVTKQSIMNNRKSEIIQQQAHI